MAIDNTLTLDSLTFALNWSDEKGSRRTESSRGPTLPEVLTIKHKDIVDTATKLPMTSSVVRLDRFMGLTAEAKIAPVSAYLVVTTPKSASIAGSDVLAAVQRLITLLQEDDSGLNLMESIYVNRLQ